MATKRKSHIDPSDAFKAIVGTSDVQQDAPLNNTTSPEEPVGEAPAFPSAQPLPATPTATPASPKAPARRGRPAGTTKAGAVPPSPPAAAGESTELEYTPKLVQKGYYLTEEQTKKLGLYAVLQDTDRSAIVRAALDMYFDAHKDVLP